MRLIDLASESIERSRKEYNVGKPIKKRATELNLSDVRKSKKEHRVGDWCPTCGSSVAAGKLVLRLNKNTGHHFVGCGNWPSCDFTCDVGLKDRKKLDLPEKKVRIVQDNWTEPIFNDVDDGGGPLPWEE